MDLQRDRLLQEQGGADLESLRLPAETQRGLNRPSSEGNHLSAQVGYFSPIGRAHPQALLLREVLAWNFDMFWPHIDSSA